MSEVFHPLRQFLAGISIVKASHCNRFNIEMVACDIEVLVSGSDSEIDNHSAEFALFVACAILLIYFRRHESIARYEPINYPVIPHCFVAVGAN